MTDIPKPAENMEIKVVGHLVQTTITLPSGTKVQLVADEKAIARQILAYRRALETIRKMPYAEE